MSTWLLPEPVVPATRPWGPWAFSCRSSIRGSPFSRMPRGAASVLAVLAVFQAARISKSSVFFAPSIRYSDALEVRRADRLMLLLYTGLSRMVASLIAARSIGLYENRRSGSSVCMARMTPISTLLIICTV